MRIKIFSVNLVKVLFKKCEIWINSCIENLSKNVFSRFYLRASVRQISVFDASIGDCLSGHLQLFFSHHLKGSVIIRKFEFVYLIPSLLDEFLGSPLDSLIQQIQQTDCLSGTRFEFLPARIFWKEKFSLAWQKWKELFERDWKITCLLPKPVRKRRARLVSPQACTIPCHDQQRRSSEISPPSILNSKFSELFES